MFQQKIIRMSIPITLRQKLGTLAIILKQLIEI